MRSRTLNEIVEACGHQAAIAITRAFGGRQLSVPNPDRMTEDHPIALTIGLTAARKLAKAKGGERLEIPSEINAVLELRNEAVCKAFDDGASIRSISFDAGISRKWVRNILVRCGREAEVVRRDVERNTPDMPATKDPIEPRNTEILEAVEVGVPKRAIAREHGIHRRRVDQIVTAKGRNRE